ncbi:MAG: GatB/YqeY domain-containing protein [Lachnospiraceae bacterium]|nr:GatB/YqeY domain-containing protein [Lachnospiraceae bacterium]
MSKIDEIRAQMVVAMKEKDKEKKDSLSMLVSALKNKEIDKREPLTEEEENEVIKKEIRQTKETLDAAPADRVDIKEQCEKRLAVYKQFVPEDLSEDAIREIIKGVLADLSIEQATPKDKGRIMKELMPKVKGKAEGSIVNKIVGEFMV